MKARIGKIGLVVLTIEIVVLCRQVVRWVHRTNFILDQYTAMADYQETDICGLRVSLEELQETVEQLGMYEGMTMGEWHAKVQHLLATDEFLNTDWSALTPGDLPEQDEKDLLDPNSF